MADRAEDDLTAAVHAGETPGPETGALDPPIVQASAFAFRNAAEAAACFEGQRDGYIYTRWGNPTVRALEEKMARLEGAEAAAAFSSGMAAVHAALTCGLSTGDHVVAPRALYAETAVLLREYLPRFGIRTSFVDATRAEAIEAALEERTRCLYVETPANPTLAVTDLEAAAQLASSAGARLVVDNTFATPWHQKPLSWGADLVVHSATKALCGHGDAIGGIVCGRAELVEAARRQGARTLGAVLAPMNAWLIARGMKTLGVRMAQASASALTLARRLASDRRIARVHYPGLETHPAYAVARRQMVRGYGAVLAFEVAGGLEAARRAYDRFELVTRAVSLGDVRTLVTHAASTTHHSMPREDRLVAGISDGLMRLAVGIEAVEDLWRDLDRALG
ncbi:MAG: aminotransferase class I/II-fold pyridoxal phosphate-dependent enzyme [Deltaproteobacteria bacterium]|nr:MAG: aminotransferase class I/II-fold pyridoxal phosphate-dependent enzyme [Deltaproteobacteria bacterium]